MKTTMTSGDAKKKKTYFESDSEFDSELDSDSDSDYDVNHHDKRRDTNSRFRI